MRHYRKVLLVLGTIALLVVLLHIGLNFWVTYQLPKIINRENDSPYRISYKKIDVSLFNSSIHAQDIVISPKIAVKNMAEKLGIYANVKSVDVAQFSLLDLLLHDKIKAESVIVRGPDIILYKKTEKAIDNPKNLSSEVVKPFSKIVVVPNVYVEKGNLKIIYIKTKKELLNVSNIRVKLEGIVITDAILARKIPFSYKTYAFDCDSLYYRSGPFYDLRTGAIATTNSGLGIKNFEMLPRVSRKAFIASIPKEKDLYTVKVKSIKVNDLDWGFKEEALFFNTRSVVVDQLSADIYRNKIPADDLSKKYLYNKLLRDLKCNLKIDTIAIRNSTVTYEEEKTFEKGPGKLKFSQFNALIRNVHSGLNQKKLPDVTLKVNCIFMQESRLAVNWRFNVLDRSDGFNIQGRLFNFDAEKMNPFLKPYMNAEAKGRLQEVYFNFTGNDDRAKGEFSLQYEDFKIAVYKKKDRRKKNKFLSAIANLFIKNDTKGDVKDAKVELDRIKEKSFYNFLWRSIAEGLKKIMI